LPGALCCDSGVKDNRPDGLRALAEQLASEAADFVGRRRAQIIDPESGGAAVRTKSSPTDPVTLADTETEQLVRDRLAELRPGETVLGEEAGGTPSASSVRWVVDPIDGTVNFLYGIPAYAVSIAAQVDGVSIAGAVADVAGGRLYSAGLGLGAHVRSDGQTRQLACNRVADLSMALLGTGFSYAKERRAAQAALLARIVPEVRDVRRIGSAALDLCMVAAGRLDAYYEHGLRVWDWAAGALIAAEAGALVALPEPDGSGAGADLLLAAAPGVSAELIRVLERHRGLRLPR